MDMGYIVAGLVLGLSLTTTSVPRLRKTEHGRDTIDRGTCEHVHREAKKIYIYIHIPIPMRPSSEKLPPMRKLAESRFI